MIRLFAALALPDAVRERLALVRGPLPGARWVPPENMHLTLRFIGEVEPPMAADIDTALGRIEAPAFELSLTEPGSFGSRGRVRALWAGVKKTDDLMRLQAKIEVACVRVGLEPERRRYHPHVTLARCKNASQDSVNAFIAFHGGFDLPMIAVDRFYLFSSRMGRSGSVYATEAVYPLKSESGSASFEISADGPTHRQ
jgi:2'-5' RNA ligase